MEECDRLKLGEAARERCLSNAKSLFLDLKFGERILETSRGDKQLKEENRRLKVEVQAKKAEIKGLEDSLAKLKISEANVVKDRHYITIANVSLMKEKEYLLKRMRELTHQVDTLQEMAKSHTASKKEREEKVFEVGRMVGIKDCAKNACKRFPEVAWAELGVEAVQALKELEVEKVRRPW